MVNDIPQTSKKKYFVLRVARYRSSIYKKGNIFEGLPLHSFSNLNNNMNIWKCPCTWHARSTSQTFLYSCENCPPWQFWRRKKAQFGNFEHRIHNSAHLEVLGIISDPAWIYHYLAWLNIFTNFLLCQKSCRFSKTVKLVHGCMGKNGGGRKWINQMDGCTD
jgi:hypothetical protein